MAKCSGSSGDSCPDNKTGSGVKKCRDGKYRCDQCRQDTIEPDSEPIDNYCCNELLCFVRNNAGIIPGEELSKICQEFYEESDIDVAYDLLFKQYKGDAPLLARDLHQDYFSALQNVVSLLKNADDNDIPKLVAANLSKIPTLCPDKIDIVSLFRDMNILRNRLDNLSRRTAEEVNGVKRDVKILYDRTQSTKPATSRPHDGTLSMTTPNTKTRPAAIVPSIQNDVITNSQATGISADQSTTESWSNDADTQQESVPAQKNQ